MNFLRTGLARETDWEHTRPSMLALSYVTRILVSPSSKTKAFAEAGPLTCRSLFDVDASVVVGLVSIFAVGVCGGSLGR